jgi:uncharacterized protein
MRFLEKIYSQSGFKKQLIKEIAPGQKYLAVLLNNGQIGVCAALGNEITKDFTPPLNLDLKNPVHRILFIAYTNANINYLTTDLGENDIFDQINFTFYSKIVMVGLFQSLLDKFDHAGLKVHVFDIEKTGGGLTHMQYQKKFLNKADAVILTSTSLVNNTFDEVIAETSPASNVYMLGPSGILSGDFFHYPQVKMVFGSLFEKNDHRVLDVIKKGHGTRHFLPYLRKVFIDRNEHETA